MPQMPPQPIDWPGIRANAAHVGIRAAARLAGADLPDIERARLVQRVMRRASREGWERAKSAAVSAIASARGLIQPANAKPLSARVRTGSESAVNSIAENIEAGRAAGYSIVRKSLERKDKGKKGVPVETAQDVRHLLATLEPKGEQTVNVSLNLAFFGK